ASAALASRAGLWRPGTSSPRAGSRSRGADRASPWPPQDAQARRGTESETQCAPSARGARLHVPEQACLLEEPARLVRIPAYAGASAVCIAQRMASRGAVALAAPLQLDQGQIAARLRSAERASAPEQALRSLAIAPRRRRGAEIDPLPVSVAGHCAGSV